MVSQHQAFRQKPSISDPLSCFLRGQLHLGYASLGSIALFYTLSLYGYLIIVNDQLDFYNAFALLFRCILFSLLPVVYLWSSDSIFHLLKALAEVRALKLTGKDWSLVEGYYRKSKFWMLNTSSSCAAFHTVLFGSFVLYSNSSRWDNINVFIKFFAVGVNAIFSYMLFCMLITLILNVKILRRLFSYKTLRVRLLHPDGCGGLKPLSRYALYSAYAIAIVGGMIGLSEYMLTVNFVNKSQLSSGFSVISEIFPSHLQMIWLVHLMVVIYLLLSFVIFFGPLLLAHKEMLEAKEGLLKDISEQFQADYNNLKNLLKADSSALSEQVEKFNQLDAIYSRTTQFPVWPFDVGILKKYFLSIAAPLIPSVTTFFVDFIQGFLSSFFYNISML